MSFLEKILSSMDFLYRRLLFALGLGYGVDQKHIVECFLVECEIKAAVLVGGIDPSDCIGGVLLE